MHLSGPKLYNGVRVVNGPCIANARRIDHGAMPLIIRMIQRGLRVDLNHFAKMEKRLTQKMEESTDKVHTLTGYRINPGSGDQVADLLFKKLKIKQIRPKMTPGGTRESVEEEVLKAVQHEHPVVPVLMEYKEFEKLRGTYVVPMPKLAKRVGHGHWRMFPNFKHTRVPSSRLSCTDPNLLAIPSRTEEGKEVRKGFITDDGYVYVSIDESQIEMRMGAHRSKDPHLIHIYRNNEDIYSDFATTAFRLEDKRYYDKAEDKWKYPTVHKMDHRYPAKTCVLASMYRVTGGGLLDQMPIICSNCNKEATKHDCGRFNSLWTENGCQNLINAFYMRYGGLVRMQKADDQYVRRHAMQCDMWGRVLHVTAARSVLEYVVSAALREAGNFPLQSGAQGTIKIVMAAVDDDLESTGVEELVHPLLQIHDELVFECREDVAEEWGGMVKWRFETMFDGVFDVPILAGVEMAPTWGDLDK